jgi:hypothetical protein
MGDVVALAQSVDIVNNFQHISQGLDKTQQHKAAFLLNYSDLAIGWKAAGMFAKAHAKLPVYLTADDHWIWRAYLVQCNPDKYFDKHVAEALALMDPSMHHEKTTIQGLLLTEDASFKDIACITAIAEDTVRAFEKLFYNVRDRFEDYLFLARSVYPHGRIEELYDRYLHNTTFGDLIRRTGYNCGKDYVTFMAGLRSNLIQDMTSGDMAVRLERTIMANGFVLASSGLINQRNDAAGVRDAKSLIAAAKAGGQDQQETSGFDDVAVSTALRGELVRIGRQNLEEQTEAVKIKFGDIIETEAVVTDN